MITGACWRCEQPGHGYADCQRPPAATRQELQARIDRLKERWNAGYGLSTSLKQQFITIETREYQKARKANAGNQQAVLPRQMRRLRP